MTRRILTLAVGLFATVGMVVIGTASATIAPPVLSAPTRVVYPTSVHLRTTFATASLPATFAVQRSFDASVWAGTGKTAAVTDTRTTGVEFTITPDRNAYWRIQESADGTTLASNVATILVGAKLTGPSLPNPLYFGRTALIYGKILPGFPVGSAAVKVVVRRWTKSGWVLVKVLPAVIAKNGDNKTGNDWQARYTPSADDIGCLMAFYALHSDPTRFKTETPSVYRKVLCPADARVVALTFDDGPWPYQTKAILGILKAAGVKATFFEVGRCVNSHPDLSRMVLAEGMLIGNHTQTHLFLGSVSYATAYGQIAQGQSSIKRATGFTPRWFRPPGGFTSHAMYDAAGNLGLRTVLWNVDPQDWRRPSASTIVARVVSQVRPGAVVIMHDGGGTRSNTIAALPYILRELKRQRYTFLTLDQFPGAEGTGRLPLR